MTMRISPSGVSWFSSELRAPSSERERAQIGRRDQELGISPGFHEVARQGNLQAARLNPIQGDACHRRLPRYGDLHGSADEPQARRVAHTVYKLAGGLTQLWLEGKTFMPLDPKALAPLA